MVGYMKIASISRLTTVMDDGTRVCITAAEVTKLKAENSPWSISVTLAIT